MNRLDLIVRNDRPEGRPPSGILISEGRIDAIVADDAPAEADFVLDGGGALVLPGLIDAHTHLDKTFLGYPSQPNGGGPEIIDFVANERRLKAKLGLDAAVQSER